MNLFKNDNKSPTTIMMGSLPTPNYEGQCELFTSLILYLHKFCCHFEVKGYNSNRKSFSNPWRL